MAGIRTGLGAKRASSGAIISGDLQIQEALIEELTNTLVYKKTDGSLISLGGASSGVNLSTVQTQIDNQYDTSRVVFVIPAVGNDSTGQIGSISKPFQTFAAAAASFSAGSPKIIMIIGNCNIGNYTMRALDQSMRIVWLDKTIISGTLNLVSANTSIYLTGPKGQFTGTVNDASLGAIYADSDLTGSTFNFSGKGYKELKGSVDDMLITTSGSALPSELLIRTFGTGVAAMPNHTAGLIDFQHRGGVSCPILTGNYPAILLQEGIQLMVQNIIVTLSRTSNVVTATTKGARNHNFKVGDVISIYGATPANMGGVVVISSVPTASTFTYSSTGSNGVSTGASIYAFGGKCVRSSAVVSTIYLKGCSTLQSDASTFGQIDMTGSGAGSKCYTWSHSQLATSGDVFVGKTLVNPANLISYNGSDVETFLNSLTTSISTINTNLGNKVDKITGKGLSTNDYTNAEKTKLEGLENFSGSYTDLTDKPTIPTVPSDISSFNNDSEYQTNSEVITSITNNEKLSRFNILSFGAVGDGTTDDSTAINNAITAAVSAGVRVVYFPDKSNGYSVGSPIALPSNIILLGDNKKGCRSSRIKPISAYDGLLIQSANHGSSLIQQSAVIGLYFDGSETTNTAVDIQSQECKVSDCTFSNMWTYGLKLSGLSSFLALNNTIQDNYFENVPGAANFWDAIFEDYYTGDNKYYNNYIQGGQDSCLKLRGQNSIVTGNHLYNSKYGIYSDESSEKIITSNYIEMMTHNGVYVNGGSSSDQRLQLTIALNEFRNINTSGEGSGVIELQGSDLKDAIITNNRVKRDVSTSYSADYLLYSVAGYSNITVSNNNLMSGVITVGETNITSTISKISTNDIDGLSDVATTGSYDDLLDKPTSIDFSHFTNDIIPNVNNALSIGSADKKIYALYLEHLYLSNNSLYMNDVKVLGYDGDTMDFKADLDQHMNVRAQGGGTLFLKSEALLKLLGNLVELSATTNLTLDGGTQGLFVSSKSTFNGDVVINGNLLFSNTAKNIELETVNLTIKDNIIVLNKGQVGTGVSAGTAGISIDRGDGFPFRLVYDEATGKLKQGLLGSEVLVPTMSDIDGKVDKVTGKALSDNNYTTTEKTKVSNLPTNTTSELANKVDKVSGKDLSTNDYTDTEKDKVAEITNKVDKVTGKGLSTEDYSTSEKNKLAGLSQYTDELAQQAVAGDIQSAVDSLLGSVPSDGNTLNKLNSKIEGISFSSDTYTKQEADNKFQEEYPAMGLSQYDFTREFRDLVYKFLSQGFNIPGKLAQYAADIRQDNIPTLSQSDAKNLINILVGSIVGSNANGFVLTDNNSKLKTIAGGTAQDYLRGDGVLTNLSDSVLDVVRQGNLINSIIASGGLKVSNARRSHSVVNETTAVNMLLPWDTAVSWDSACFSYNSTTKLITVLKAGVLWVSAQSWVKSNSRGSLCIYRNGSEIINPVGNEENTGGMSGYETGCAIKVGANDTIGVRSYGTNSASYSIYQSPNYSFFSMMLLYV